VVELMATSLVGGGAVPVDLLSGFGNVARTTLAAG